MNRSTIWRYKSDLKRVGIGHAIQSTEGVGILEQLIMPSPNARFDLNDLKL